MSYFDERQNTYFGSQGFSRDFAVTPMEADIVAMQTLYGLSTTTRSGDTVYGFNSNAGGVYDASVYPNVALTIFDSGGNDTLNYSQSSASQLINLNPETFSNVDGNVGNLSIGRGVVIENAIGGSGADTIIGNSANNVLTGGLGSDVLTGGGGNDTFLDTISGHNGDKITDFSSADKLVFSDASLSNFSFSLSGTTLTYTGGSLTFGSAPGGTFTASAASGGGIQLTLATTSPAIIPGSHTDFNGDGRDDLLLRSDSGSVTDWLGQASGAFTTNSANFLSQVDSGWQIVGAGDFNGDGRSDILWRSGSGLVTDWLASSNGSFYGNSSNFLSQVDSSWHIVGTGDFNGDGRSDILWRSDSGLVTDWLATANGSFYGNASNFLSQMGATWHVAATGDFNGDGLTDILWYNDAGTVTDWLGQPNGGFTQNGANFQAQVGTSWHVAGVGDFNGDGRADILWLSDSGQVTDWLADSHGGFYGNSASFLTQVAAGSHVVETGDFNGNGVDDVLWRGSDGSLTEWLGQPNGALAVNPNFSPVHDAFF
jgi:hypothetical protein